MQCSISKAFFWEIFQSGKIEDMWKLIIENERKLKKKKMEFFLSVCSLAVKKRQNGSKNTLKAIS